MTTFLFILMLTVFISYVTFVIISYGVQPSISESYYKLPQRLKFLFTLFCLLFAIPAIILGDNVLMFLAGSGIAFVGAAATFKDKMTYEVHMIGAYAGVLLSQISIWYNYHMWYITIIFIILSGTLLLLKVKNKIWWSEILAFLSICIVLYFNLNK